MSSSLSCEDAFPVKGFTRRSHNAAGGCMNGSLSREVAFHMKGFTWRSHNAASGCMSNSQTFKGQAFTSVAVSEGLHMELLYGCRWLHEQFPDMALLPIRLNRNKGRWSSMKTYTMGAMADSYYEYLLKMWLIKQQKVCLDAHLKTLSLLHL